MKRIKVNADDDQNLWRFDYDGESVKLIATEEKAMEMVNELGTLRL